MGKKAFTLVDLLLVLALLALLAGVILPSFSGTLAYYRHTSTLRQIASDLRGLQQKAISQYQEHGIRFQDKSYELGEIEGSTKSWVKIATIELPGGNFISETSYPQGLTFGTLGEPLPQGGFIKIEDSFGHKNYITISSATGRVKISDEPPPMGI